MYHGRRPSPYTSNVLRVERWRIVRTQPRRGQRCPPGIPLSYRKEKAGAHHNRLLVIGRRKRI